MLVAQPDNHETKLAIKKRHFCSTLHRHLSYYFDTEKVVKTQLVIAGIFHFTYAGTNKNTHCRRP